MRNAAEYRLKTPKVFENTVVKAYHSIEDGVVSAYKRIEDKFVDTFLEKVDDSDGVTGIGDTASPHGGK